MKRNITCPLIWWTTRNIPLQQSKAYIMIDGMSRSCSNSSNRCGIFCKAKKQAALVFEFHWRISRRIGFAAFWNPFTAMFRLRRNQHYFLLIHYTKRKNRNRVQENSAVFFAKQKNRQHKSLLSSGIFEEFLYNFLTGRDFNTATLIKFCKIYIKCGEAE